LKTKDHNLTFPFPTNLEFSGGRNMEEIREDHTPCLQEEEASLSKLAVIAGIPAFNAEKTITRVVLEAQKHVHVVLVCDDGSSDLTGQIATQLGAVLVKHERNQGYGAALKSLLEKASELNADVLVTLDSDGQHNPAEIPQIIKPIEDEAAEVVLGSRFLERNGTEEMPLYRRVGIKIITKLLNGFDKKRISDAQTGFRAYSKIAIEQLSSISEKGMGASIELLLVARKSGLKICEIPISCRYEKSLGVKTSTQNPIIHGANLLVTLVKLVVEDKPWMCLGFPGVMCLTIGCLFGAWMLSAYATTQTIVMNTAFASLAFLSTGFFALSTAIVLNAVKRLENRLNREKISAGHHHSR
jgi:hypothetical protein